MRNKYWLLGLGALLLPSVARSQRAPAVLSMLDGAEPDGALRYVGGAMAQRAGNGQDIGAQINAAYASLPAHGGTIVVIADPAGRCYDFITPIVAATPGKYLLLESGTLPSQIVHAPSVACLNYLPTNSTSAITLDYTSPADNAGLQIHGIHQLTLTNNRCETIGGCGNDAAGVSVVAADGASVDGLRVVGFGAGISVTGSARASLSLSNCSIFENGVGLLNSHSEGAYLSIDVCQFQGNGTGISSAASLRVSNSSIVSSTVLGINCSSPAACDLSNDHFQNAEADTTHFLAGNGVFSVLGGDMRDDRSTGNTDWWMNFAGSSFLVVGIVLNSGGRSSTNLVRNESAGFAQLQNTNVKVLDAACSKPTEVLAVGGRDVSSSVVKRATIDGASIALNDSPTVLPVAHPSSSVDRSSLNSDATQSKESASLSATQRNDVISVDGVKFKTIDQAVNAMEGRPGVVIIPPTYRGPESKHLITENGMTFYDGRDNVTIWDYRFTNDKAYHINLGGTTLGSLSRVAVTQRKNSPGTTTSAILGTNFITGRFPLNSGTLAAITAQTTLNGSITTQGSRSHVVGIESYVEIIPRNRVSLPEDARAFTASVNIDREEAAGSVPTAVGYFANTHTNVSRSGGKIANAYGFDAAPQVNGTLRNAGYHNQGDWLTENDTAFDAVNAAGLVTHAIFWRRSELTEFRPLNDKKGWEFLTNNGTGIFHLDSDMVVSRVMHEFPVGLRIGNGPTLETSEQSGTGPLCMASGCSLAKPSINGVPAGSNQVLAIAGSFITTSSITDTVNIPGVTEASRCSLTPTNSLAAAGTPAGFIFSKQRDQVTVRHSPFAGMSFDLICTPN